MGKNVIIEGFKALRTAVAGSFNKEGQKGQVPTREQLEDAQAAVAAQVIFENYRHIL